MKKVNAIRFETRQAILADIKTQENTLKKKQHKNIALLNQQYFQSRKIKKPYQIHKEYVKI